MKKNKVKKGTAPITRKGDVQQSNDEHIDQDFPGFPGNPAKEDIISPKTHADHVAANAEDVEIIPRNNQSSRYEKIKFDCAGGSSSFSQKFEADIYDHWLE
ncbi:MAG TPA: hypothetical protein PLP23_13135 [Panacibacter sp.]|nr:hypothetical protein [Panacibacter sp.]